MKIVLLIIAIIVMVSHCMNAHIYKTNYYQLTKRSHFILLQRTSLAGLSEALSHLPLKLPPAGMQLTILLNSKTT